MPLLIPYKVIKDTSSIIGSTSKQAVMWHIRREGWSDPAEATAGVTSYKFRPTDVFPTSFPALFPLPSSREKPWERGWRFFQPAEYVEIITRKAISLLSSVESMQFTGKDSGVSFVETWNLERALGRYQNEDVPSCVVSHTRLKDD